MDERIETFAHGSTYSKARMRYLLGMWVSRRSRPYIIVQDPELLEIFKMLYAKVEVPHPTTLSRDVKEMFIISRKYIFSLLQVSRVLVTFEIPYQLTIPIELQGQASSLRRRLDITQRHLISRRYCATRGRAESRWLHPRLHQAQARPHGSISC